MRRLPSGPDWRYELKLGGYRAEGIKTPDRVRLISRNRNDLSAAYAEITDAVSQLSLRHGVLDGGIAAVDAAGKPSFQRLQHAGPADGNARPIFYFAFDLLNLEGKSLLSLPLLDRKRLLEQVLRKAPAQLRFAGFLEPTTSPPPSASKTWKASSRSLPAPCTSPASAAGRGSNGNGGSSRSSSLAATRGARAGGLISARSSWATTNVESSVTPARSEPASPMCRSGRS